MATDVVVVVNALAVVVLVVESILLNINYCWQPRNVAFSLVAQNSGFKS